MLIPVLKDVKGKRGRNGEGRKEEEEERCQLDVWADEKGDKNCSINTYECLVQ